MYMYVYQQNSYDKIWDTFDHASHAHQFLSDVTTFNSRIILLRVYVHA